MIEEFIAKYKNKLQKDFEDIKAKGKKIADKQSPSVDEMLDNSYEMGYCMGEIDMLNDLTMFLIKQTLAKSEMSQKN